MRKLLVLLAAIALAGGVASAQNYWAGLSVGTGASVHFGLEDIAPNLDVRANLGFGYAFFGVGLEFGADALYGLPLDLGDVPIETYAGAGLIAGIYPDDFDLAVNVLFGGEYRLGDLGLEPGGVFFELGPVVEVTDFGFGFLGRLGFNYHF